MSIIKEKLSGALGTAGVVIWYFISFLYSFSPLLFLRFPFIVDVLLIAAMTTLPIAGEAIRLILYVWAFIVVIGQPIDVFSIIFFVLTALYLYTTVYPFVISLLSNSKKNDL